MFGTPYLAYNPPLGAVVGTDPYDDTDDGTYIQATANASFCHVNAAVEPASFDTIPEFVVRASATTVGGTEGRLVMNFYPPGEIYGTSLEPTLNFTQGPNPVYVVVTADGAIRDIPVSFTDWVTNAPATLAQINAYFAAGGTLLVQPVTSTGSSEVTLRVHRISVGGTVLPYRRTFPRDDVRRTWPRPKSYQGSNRTGGGYP